MASTSFPIDMKVAVAESEKQKGEDAAAEIIEKISAKVPKPKFILLFTTIHYKNEFRPLLSGIKKAFPDSPLIGGTVTGFITRKNCYVKGVAAFALYYPHMDIAVGVGHHTKTMPKRAARKCAEMIKEGLKDSKYENKLLIDIISGPTMPKVPFKGRINNIKSKPMGDILSYIFTPLFSYLGEGVGKEEEVVEQLGISLPEYYFIGGSAIDDINYRINFQFFENEIYKNSIVSVGISIEDHVNLNTITGSYPINKKFTISKTFFNKRIITKIGDKPAKKAFLDLLGVTDEQFGQSESFYYKTSDYFPITFEENREFISGVGGFFGDNIVLGYKVAGEHAELLSISGKEIIGGVDDFFRKLHNSLPFMLMFSSGVRMNILGKNVFSIKNKIDNHLEGVPYLVCYTINENVQIPNSPPISRVYSINGVTFKEA